MSVRLPVRGEPSNLRTHIRKSPLLWTDVPTSYLLQHQFHFEMGFHQAALPSAPQSLLGQVMYALGGIVIVLILLAAKYPDRLVGTHARKGTEPVSNQQFRGTSVPMSTY